jgi:hypothetical protein
MLLLLLQQHMCRCVLHLAVDWLSDGPARLQVWCAAAAVPAGIFVAGAQGVRRGLEALQLLARSS